MNFSLLQVVSRLLLLKCMFLDVSFAKNLVEMNHRYSSFGTFAKAVYILESMYVDPEKVTPEQTIQHALEGVIANLDPHTVLMPKKAFEQLTIDTRGKFGGVGIIVSHERDKLIIISPIEGTPAMEAGIEAGDEIISIDDQLISSLAGQDAVDLMRGEPGSKIKLEIRRKEVKDTLIFEMKRDIIKVRSVRSFELSDDILYVRITSFQEDTSIELQKILKKYGKKIKGLILDLRDNPGGLLDQSILVSDSFIESGLIVSTVGRDPDRIEREFAHKKNTFINFPMIVLINEGSASASEIVAGALQDHQRALIVGTKSFGKGSVQTIISLPDGSGLKLTVAKYYTPNDRSIQAKGIEPDIIVHKKKDRVSGEKKTRESDLDRHIESSNLSNFVKQSHPSDKMNKWPKSMRSDYQLEIAYVYIKGWSNFSKMR